VVDAIGGIGARLCLSTILCFAPWRRRHPWVSTSQAEMFASLALDGSGCSALRSRRWGREISGALAVLLGIGASW